jgi:CRP-like cAMP-binding protein
MRGIVLMKEGEIGDQIFVLKKGYLKIEKNYVNEKNIYYKEK